MLSFEKSLPYLGPFADLPRAFTPVVVALLSLRRLLVLVTESRVRFCTVRITAADVSLLHGRVPREAPWVFTSWPLSMVPMRTILAAFLHFRWCFQPCVFAQIVLDVLRRVVQFHHAVDRPHLEISNPCQCNFVVFTRYLSKNKILNLSPGIHWLHKFRSTWSKLWGPIQTWGS